MKHLKTLITLFLLVIGTSVLWAEDDESVPARTAVWNWKTGSPIDISAQTNFENIEGDIYSDPTDQTSLKLHVDAKGGSFKFIDAGRVDYAKLTNGCKVRVPVRRINDVVTVTCQAKYNYTIGGVDVNTEKKVYEATAQDAAQGYVVIKATGDVHFYQIDVVQSSFSSILPMIQLNKEGWASFTSLIPGYVVKLPSNSTAYVATAVYPDEGDFGKVILTKVEKFGYGEGVFIHGPQYEGVNATIVKGGESDVPKIENNITLGCTEDVSLTYESCAYVMATQGENEAAGFYHVTAPNDKAITVPAGKAFLYDPQGQAKLGRRAKFLRIEFADGSEATGIESVLAGAKTEAPTVFYNLSGQKVGKDYKGIVIGNDGKKYVK